jgi:hypothetical protein
LPNFIMFGREVLTPFDYIAKKPPPEVAQTMDEYVAELREDMEQVYDAVRRNIRVAALRRKIYDVTVKMTEFLPGKFVWIYQPRACKRLSPKWTSYYIRTCLVERRINAVTYVVERSPAGQPFVAHVDKLKPFNGDLPNVWIRYLESHRDETVYQDDAPNDGASDVLTRQTPVETTLNYDSCVPHELHTESSEEVEEKNALTIESADENSIDPCIGRVKDTALARHTRARQQPAWQKDFVCAIQLNAMKPKGSQNNSESKEKQMFVCNQRDNEGHVCGRTFSTDSGIRRHCVTAHGRRYHADRLPSPTDRDECQQRLSVIRTRQQNSKTRRRNERRRLKRAMERDVPTGSSFSSSAAVSVIRTSVPEIASGTAMTVATGFENVDWSLDVTDRWDSVGGGSAKLADVDDILTYLGDLFPESYPEDAADVQGGQLSAIKNPTMADRSATSTGGVATADAGTATDASSTRSVAVSTIDVSVQSVGVGHLRLDDGEDVVRGYERPLQLPGRVALDDLCRLFRRHSTVHSDAMARHLANAAFFGRPFGGIEHKLVEFAQRAMVAAEQVIAAELLDVCRSACMTNDANYARQSFDLLYSSIRSHPA